MLDYWCCCWIRLSATVTQGCERLCSGLHIPKKMFGSSNNFEHVTTIEYKTCEPIMITTENIHMYQLVSQLSWTMSILIDLDGLNGLGPAPSTSEMLIAAMNSNMLSTWWLLALLSICVCYRTTRERTRILFLVFLLLSIPEWTQILSYNFICAFLSHSLYWQRHHAIGWLGTHCSLFPYKSFHSNIMTSVRSNWHTHIFPF